MDQHEKGVLFCLITRGYYTAFPSQDTLALDTGFSKSSVRRAIERLKLAGLLVASFRGKSLQYYVASSSKIRSHSDASELRDSGPTDHDGVPAEDIKCSPGTSNSVPPEQLSTKLKQEKEARNRSRKPDARQGAETMNAGRGKSYMTEDWQPSETAQEFAKSEGVDWKRVRDEFVDYWLGCGKPMANWDAVFRNRVRAMLADGKAPLLPPPPPPPPKPIEIDPDALTGEAATKQAMALQAKLFNMGKR